MKSKILIFHGAGQPLTPAECTVPALQEGEVLVRNEYATLCRSDISTYTGRRTEKTPTILGHETVGRIEALGSPVADLNGRPLRVGQRIAWAIYAAAPTSEMARRGMPQKAPDLFKYGHERLTPTSTLHGGLARHTLLRRHTPILPLDEDIPLQAASVTGCAVATAAGALRLTAPLQGRRVALWGSGMLGLMACAMCREQGAASVTAIDVDTARLETARRFGADHTLDASDDEALRSLEADVTLDFSGNARAMEASVEALATGGTAVWVGGVHPQPDVRLRPEQFIRRLRTVRGLHNYNAADFAAAVAFVTNGWRRYPIASLVYDGFTLDEADAAFAYATAHNPFRVGIRL